MSQFMNLNFGIPLQNMNQQFINQNRMNMNMFTQNNNIYQLFTNFFHWMNYNNINNNMNNMNNGNNLNMNNNMNNINNFGNENNNNFNINGGNNRNGDINTVFKNEYPGEDPENLRNVIFSSSSGFKVLIVVPYFETICHLLHLFVKKIGIGENSLEKDIFFIFNGTYLKANDQRAIYEICRYNIPSIIVIEAANILGATSKE